MEAALIAAVKAHPIVLPTNLESLLAKLKYKRATIDHVPKAMAAHLMKQLSKVIKHHMQVQISEQLKPDHQVQLDTYHAALKRQASSFFYIFQVSPNVIKLGLTGNLNQRQKTLQTYREKKVKLIGFVEHISNSSGRKSWPNGDLDARVELNCLTLTHCFAMAKAWSIFSLPK
jgi:hypothetical protein